MAPETYSPPPTVVTAEEAEIETPRGSYEMDTGFAVFKLRVLESLVHSDSMADLKGSVNTYYMNHIILEYHLYNLVLPCTAIYTPHIHLTRL